MTHKLADATCRDECRMPRRQARPDLYYTQIAKAKAAYALLTPEQQWIFGEQRKSWGIGYLMLAHPEMTRAEAAARVEAAL